MGRSAGGVKLNSRARNVSGRGRQRRKRAARRARRATWRVFGRLVELGSGVRAAGRSKILSWLVACTFFALYYFYLHECLDPRLIYHAHEVALPSGRVIDFPIYFRGAEFFGGFLAYPGGLAEYVAARCCQYYYYPHLGPLILTGVAGLVYVLTDWLIKISGGKGSRGLRYVPPLLLLIAYNQYTFRLENFVALIAALMLAVFYNLVASRPGKAPVHFLLFAAVSIPLYYAAGGVYLLFAALCALPELLARRRYILGGLYLLSAAGIPLAGKYFFAVTLADACLFPSGIYPFENPAEAAPLWAVYLFFVLVAVILPFGQQLGRTASAVASRAGRVGKCCRNAELRLAGSILALVVASALVAVYTLDRDARAVLRTNYLARSQMWPEFLAEVEHYPTRDYPPSLMVDINRALYETGQLGTRMFSYPQNPQALFELGPQAVPYQGGCDVLLRLGRINEAEHTALEALEMNGPRPRTLRQLALVCVVKRRPEAARVFLGALSKDIIHGRWAEDYLRRLDHDPLMSSDPQIQYLRSVMPLSDTVTESKELILLALLARNPKNRMALEYLMAYYLLTRQPGKVACNIGRLEEFDYPTIPADYAEAILLYAHNVGGQRVLGERTMAKIEKSVLDRARKVIQIAQDCGGEKKAIAAALAASYPNSCSRYLLTGKSGDAR